MFDTGIESRKRRKTLVSIDAIIVFCSVCRLKYPESE